jgi:hypothetical protein
MPSFFPLCLNLFCVKPAVTAEPHAVASIVGTRPPSRMGMGPGGDGGGTRPGSRMSSRYATSMLSAPVAARLQHGRGNKGSAPPSAYLERGRQPMRPASRSSRAESVSSVVSERRAETVGRVRARYQNNPTEHMRLVDQIKEWKQVDDSLNLPRPPRAARNARAASPEDGERRWASDETAISTEPRIKHVSPSSLLRDMTAEFAPSEGKFSRSQDSP